jgi:hypothetical protein
VESSPDNVLSIFNDAKEKVHSIYEEIKWKRNHRSLYFLY